MKFKRADILTKLRAARQQLIDEVEEYNRSIQDRYDEDQNTWFDRNEDNLLAMKAALDLVVENRRPLVSDHMSKIPPWRHVVSLWAPQVPSKRRVDTQEIDAGIALLESALDEHITLSEMEKAGVYVRRWVTKQ